MVIPSNEGILWNHAAVQGESKDDGQQTVLENPEEQEEGNFASTSGQLSCPRRGRSMSVASAQPSVETVVSKAKRAASTLWTLLHAQVGMCR